MFWFQCKDDRKEEFSDWPQALLAIGTFGNKEISEKQETTQHDDESSEDELHEDETSQDLQDFTLEEVTKLQNELTKLLKHKPKPKPDAPEITGEDRANLPLNRFLNCPSSLEVERIANINEAKIILNKAKDALMDNGSKIRRRSISFLLKKMFVCKSGLPPMPNIRDSVPESKIDKVYIYIYLHILHEIYIYISQKVLLIFFWIFFSSPLEVIKDDLAQENISSEFYSNLTEEVLG